MLWEETANKLKVIDFFLFCWRIHPCLLGRHAGNVGTISLYSLLRCLLLASCLQTISLVSIIFTYEHIFLCSSVLATKYLSYFCAAQFLIFLSLFFCFIPFDVNVGVPFLIWIHKNASDSYRKRRIPAEKICCEINARNISYEDNQGHRG